MAPLNVPELTPDFHIKPLARAALSSVFCRPAGWLHPGLRRARGCHPQRSIDEHVHDDSWSIRAKDRLPVGQAFPRKAFVHVVFRDV